MKTDTLTGHKPKIDLSWKRYGRSTVQDTFQRASNGGTKWLVECDCGNQWWAWAEIIKRSPGLCCKKCRNKLVAKARTIHGGKYTKLYVTWWCMRSRCYNPKNESYHNYGGRGITVCERWRTSFTCFREDMGDIPFPGLTIERNNVNGNYEPSNCSWATRREQANNRRNNVFLTYNGRTQTIAQWCRELGLDKTTVRQRWVKGMTVEQCLSKENFRY